MGWLSPWMLLGLGALVVPVVVHLVHREWRTGRPFPSLMFLARIPFQSRRRKRLRDPWLLLLRALALAALVLAFAGPLLPADTLGPPPAPSRQDTVLLLDVSYSMSSPARWAEAGTLAAARIDDAVAGGRAALLAFDDRPRLLATFGRDAATLERHLASVQPGHGGTRFADALDAAATLLAEGGAERRRIVLISDLQQSGLARGGPLSLPEGIELQLAPVTAPVGENLALLDARLAPVEITQDAAVAEALLVSVRNTGDVPVSGRRLTMSVDGIESDRSWSVSLAPGALQQLPVPLVLAADRPTRIELRLSADAIPADDVFHGVLAARRPIRVALAESSVRRRYPGVYLEQALLLARSPPIEVRRVSADALSQRLLADFDVLLLDDVVVPQGAAERAVRGFLRGGGGVLISAGPERAASWEVAGDGLVPGAPRGVLKPLSAAVLEGDPSEPLWQLAGAEPGQLLRHVRINALMALVAAAGDRVLARIGDGAPLLIERRLGAGRVMTLATTADPRWSSLALEPGFVPLIQSMVTLLAGRRPAPVAERSSQVVDLMNHVGQLPGDSGWREHLGAGAELMLERPDGSAGELPTGSSVFRASLPGVYEVHRRDGSGPALAVAVNPDSGESAFEPVTPERFQALLQRRPALAGGGERAQAVPDPGRGEQIARGLLLLAAMLFAIESLLSTLMSRRPVNQGVPIP